MERNEILEAYLKGRARLNFLTTDEMERDLEVYTGILGVVPEREFDHYARMYHFYKGIFINHMDQMMGGDDR